jgi:diguanylate cyclase (GGDEF)-like protein
LEFSGYYRENNFLKQDNFRLKQGNIMAILGMIIISSCLIIILILFRLLSIKNLTDQLTSIYNRKKLIQLSKIYQQKGTPEAFGAIMIDIDYFKLYNDTYGHIGGDTILKQVAKMLLRSVRANDFVIRYGGEEFLLILNNVTTEEAEAICQRIHHELETLHLPHRASKVSDHVTVTVSLCHQQKENTFTMDTPIQQADESLYQSKEAGRNRTTLWSAT